jgi:acyl carrier protein
MTTLDPTDTRTIDPTIEVPTEADVLGEIRRILRDELELDQPLSPGDDLAAGLALDSLSRTVLAVGLEDRFHVRLTEEDAQLQTVGELARAIALRAREGTS